MNIYILSPENTISGGPELSHQFCEAINRLTDNKSYICYVCLSYPYGISTKASVPEAYKTYNVEFCQNLEEIDRDENVVVFPEGLTHSMQYFKKAKKILWWMSVDNYIESTHESNLDDIEQNVFMHLFQSNYSMDYVKKVLPKADGMYLSDYINEEHGKFLYPAEFRQNIAFYNPAKGYEEIRPLIDRADWIRWIPLVNLDLYHMVLLLQSGKIYVDFGSHPGKDRIPREAAANGCCVITNQKGSAAFYEDLPIPQKYKFENPRDNLESINDLMHEICSNFSKYQEDFSDYRNLILGEKRKFEKDVKIFANHLLERQ